MNKTARQLEKIYYEKFPGSPGRLFVDLLNLVMEVKKCCGPTGEDLLHSLLNNFQYISNDDYEQSIDLIAEYINSEFDLTSCILCATTADRQKDSGQKVLYDVCTSLGMNHRHTKVNNLNRFDVVVKHIKKSKTNIDSIILLDEFVGSGQSLLGRINKIKTDCTQSKIIIPKIHVFIIAGMNHGLQRIRPHVDSVYPCFALVPGIRGYLERDAQLVAYRNIDSFEDTLNQNIDGQLLPKHGYGECEALYARNRGNCPNSVFPMFWWPELVSGQKRVTPFIRIS